MALLLLFVGTMCRTSAPVSATEPLATLLAKAKADQTNSDRRNRIQGVSLDILGEKRVDRVFPVDYAEERIEIQGSSVARELAELLERTNDSQLVHIVGGILAYSDRPEVLGWLCAAQHGGKLRPGALTGLVVNAYLPTAPTSDESPASLCRESNTDYGTLVLRCFDRVFSPEVCGARGIFPGVVDARVLRWFNRVYDRDFDEWLTQVAPDALAFRESSLAKGWDPVRLERLVADLYMGEPDGAIAKVYASEADQVACRRLLQAAYDQNSPLHPRQVAGWEARLHDWYWAYRDRFVYDHTKHRFVIADGNSALP